MKLQLLSIRAPGRAPGRPGTRTARLAGAVAGLAALAVTVTACGNSASPGGDGSAASGIPSIGSISQPAPPRAGGSITVLEGQGFSGDWPDGLDPATNADGAANQDYMSAIYGQLFELGPTGHPVPDLATGYKFSDDAETVTITLRRGVKFTDGTPFNAQAVYWNWQRDFGPLAAHAGVAPPWPVARATPGDPASAPAAGAIQVTSPYTIVVHQTAPNGAFIDQLYDTGPDWIASPTAVQAEGEREFARYPVGAGPFEVVRDSYSSVLVVRRNPGYWQRGRPYLDEITFRSVDGDEAAYESMLAGQGQVYEDMSATQLLDEAGQHFQELNQLGTSPYDLQLNTASAPFSDIRARQAIYAATNFTPILKTVFGDRYQVTQSFTGPGGICYQPRVSGYQGYDPALARKLAAESGLDKVTFQLGTINSSPVALQAAEALKGEWAAAGIHVTIKSWSLAGLTAAFKADGGKDWQAMIQTAGAFDPAGLLGVGLRFSSRSPLSGVHDPVLDQLLAQAQEHTNLAQRCAYYHQAARYIAAKYYGPFFFSFAPANISVRGIGGPGLTTSLPAVALTPTIPWESVYYNPAAS